MDKNNHGRFSKRVITAIVVFWFVVGIWGMFIITYQLFTTPELINLEVILGGYVGAPMGYGLVGYFVKSALENRKKIEKSSELDGSEEDFDDAEFEDDSDEFSEL